MKKTLFLIVSSLLFCYGCQTMDNSVKKGWKLVWSDEFNGNIIDETIWSKVPRSTPDWKNYMSDWDSLYAVESGNLVLWGVQNISQTNDSVPFLTGGIWGMGKKSFGLGRLEICAKLDQAQGFWPAIWLLPEIPNRIWPQGGEIDIMEHLNFDTIVYQTIHSPFTLNQQIKNKPQSSGTTICYADQCNVFAVERYCDSIVFFVNDQRTFGYYRNDSLGDQQFPFSDHPFYLILSAQLGGSWVGAVNAEHLPVAMYIDWVRFYEPEN